MNGTEEINTTEKISISKKAEPQGHSCPEPYRDRVATTEVQNAWSSRDSRRLQIVPGSALAGNSNCKNRVTELRFLVISRQ